MAVGKKTKPAGTFEIGDLIYSKISGGVYYLSNSLTSESKEIEETDNLVGQITGLDIPASGTETTKFVGVRLAFSPNIVYVPFDTSLYEVKVNPEYNYGESTGRKGFNWQGIFEGISGVSNAVLGIFGNAAKRGTPIGEQQLAAEKPEEPLGIWGWIKKNILLIVIMPTFLILIILVIRALSKPKTAVTNTPVTKTPPQLFK